jgi:hypothetical protein
MRVLLSYASFAYHTAGKNFKIRHISTEFISFWYDNEESKSHSLQVIIDSPESDCGYVVLNSEKFDTIFKKDDDLIDKLKSGTRIHREVNGNIKILEHCKINIPRSIREEFTTKDENDEEIICKSIKRKDS